MYIIFDDKTKNSSSKGSDKSTSAKKNLGSSQKLFAYLDKENKGLSDDEKDQFFNQDRDDISAEEATDKIDANKAKLGKNDEKYVSMIISPSPEEIKAIDGDVDKMKLYVRKVMNEYAVNFNRGLTGDDLLYFAKIERTRKFVNSDIEVKNGYAKVGELKAGDQMHAHVVVSRKDITNTKRLSPNTEARGTKDFFVPTKSEKITKGFDRSNMISKSEKIFDELFEFDRPLDQSFDARRAKGKTPTVRSLDTETAKISYAERNINKIAASSYHPEEEAVVSKDNRIIYRRLDSLPKRSYSETHISKIPLNFENKKLVDSHLKQRGISISKSGSVGIAGSKIPMEKLNLNSSAIDMLKFYYLSKELGRSLEGKGREGEEDDEKERL